MDWPSVQDLGPKFNNVCQTSVISVLLDVHYIEKRRIQLNEHSDKHILLYSTEIMSLHLDGVMVNLSFQC